MPSKKVVIVGGGFAGLECARALAGDRRFEVTLLDRTNHHLFQPLLYQVATASISAPDIARSLRQILAEAENVTVLLDEVVELGLEDRAVAGKSGHRYEYDYLALAVGACTSYFGNAAWKEHTLSLKSLEEAREVRRTVLSNLEQAEMEDDPGERARLMTVAIVGGGPTGVELAGAFADLSRRTLRRDYRRIDVSKLRIVLVEASGRLLMPYDEDQSEYARQRLEGLGVEVWTDKRVGNISEGTLEFDGAERLEAGAIIWAAGMEANPLTRQLGVPLADRAGRVTPRADLSLPGKPEVFVLGDLVSMKDDKGEPIPGVAPAAVQMGDHVARLLKEECRIEKTRYADRKDEFRPQFRYRDKGIMAIIGKNAAVVKSGDVRLQGFVAWLAWLFVHLLFLIGFRNKLSVLLSWAYAYLHDAPDKRIIVSSPKRDLEGKPAREVAGAGAG